MAEALAWHFYPSNCFLAPIKDRQEKIWQISQKFCLRPKTFDTKATCDKFLVWTAGGKPLQSRVMIMVMMMMMMTLRSSMKGDWVISWVLCLSVFYCPPPKLKGATVCAVCTITHVHYYTWPWSWLCALLHMVMTKKRTGSSWVLNFFTDRPKKFNRATGARFVL